MKKGFVDWLHKESPDVICIQETKASSSQVDFDSPGYTQFWNSAEKKGYSGTLVFTKKEPINSIYTFSLIFQLLAKSDHENSYCSL